MRTVLVTCTHGEAGEIVDPSVAEPLWKRMREWVVLGDGPATDLCLFLEECGAVLAPGPYFPTTVLALPLARAAGLALADELSAGAATATIAMAGSDGEWRPNDQTTKTFVLWRELRWRSSTMDFCAINKRSALRKNKNATRSRSRAKDEQGSRCGAPSWHADYLGSHRRGKLLRRYSAA